MFKQFIKNLYKFGVKYFALKCSIKFKTIIDNITFVFYDSAISRMVKSVSAEINTGAYSDIKSIKFEPGDVIIDIGGNIGVVSIYLAKKYPFLKIYAYEPVLENYKNFKKNLKLNNISENVVKLEHMAVTCDGRTVSMNINPINSGGGSLSEIIGVGSIKQRENTNVSSTTIENIKKQNNIDKIKLLKIDCEGSEYEILENLSSDVLKKIELIRGEFHENRSLTDKYDADRLLDYTCKHIKDCKIKISRDCFIM